MVVSHSSELSIVAGPWAGVGRVMRDGWYEGRLMTLVNCWYSCPLASFLVVPLVRQAMGHAHISIPVSIPNRSSPVAFGLQLHFEWTVVWQSVLFLFFGPKPQQNTCMRSGSKFSVVACPVSHGQPQGHRCAGGLLVTCFGHFVFVGWDCNALPFCRL